MRVRLSVYVIRLQHPRVGVVPGDGEGACSHDSRALPKKVHRSAVARTEGLAVEVGVVAARMEGVGEVGERAVAPSQPVLIAHLQPMLRL